MDIETLTVKSEDRAHTLTVQLPSTIEEAINLYGEERTVSIVREKVKNMFSNAARILMQKGYTEEVVQGKMDRWAPFSNIKLVRKKILEAKKSEAIHILGQQLELEIQQEVSKQGKE